MDDERGYEAPINQAIADEIKGIRGRKCLTQRQVADGAGLNYYVYRRYEKGERDLTVDKLDAIAKVLDVPADQIWRDAVAHARLIPLDETSPLQVLDDRETSASSHPE